MYVNYQPSCHWCRIKKTLSKYFKSAKKSAVDRICKAESLLDLKTKDLCLDYISCCVKDSVLTLALKKSSARKSHLKKPLCFAQVLNAAFLHICT